MVLFVKHWAKVRGINSGYRGTLSSYGYVMMVLHYLVNVAQPFVCPNLQQLAQPPPANLSQAEAERLMICKGYNVHFWRNEAEILQLARDNMLNRNTDSLGFLLRGFFEYYAHGGPLSSGAGRGFDWGRDVLSLRTPGGRLSKQDKGWTGARTVREVQAPNPEQGHQAEQQSPVAKPDQTQPAKNGDVKEVRYRYLFAIEDPFELDHNIARTVTHNGIVSIRDEFRRAWSILQAAGKGFDHDDLLKDAAESSDTTAQFQRLLDDIHGITRR
jgi:terminal uridylyltransferase